MKANKVVVTIKVESLSIDVLPSLLMEVINQVKSEYENGKLEASDGDSVEWKTERNEVEIK